MKAIVEKSGREREGEARPWRRTDPGPRPGRLEGISDVSALLSALERVCIYLFLYPFRWLPLQMATSTLHSLLL